MEYITDDHLSLEFVFIAAIHQKCLITQDQGNEEGQNRKDLAAVIAAAYRSF